MSTSQSVAQAVALTVAQTVVPTIGQGNGGRSIEVLTVRSQDEIFALEIRHVREILDLIPITEVPGSRPFVNGLINVRGKVVPLADLRLKFGMEPAPPTIDTRIVVVEIDMDGVPMTVGIRADKVYEVTELSAATLEETPRIGMRWRREFIRCIGKRGNDFIIVLDLDRIFRDETDAEPAVVGEPARLRGAAGRDAERERL